MQGAVLPWYQLLIEKVFDPSSVSHGRFGSEIIMQLLDYDIPTEKSSLLLEMVYSKFESVLSNVCVPCLRTFADGFCDEFLLIEIARIGLILSNFGKFKTLLSPVVVCKFGIKIALEKCCDCLVKIFTSVSDKVIIFLFVKYFW